MHPETHMKHTYKTSETLKTYACNVPLKQLQHMQLVQHPPIYFCNIHMKQLQHTSETPETLKTYICNIGEGKAGRSISAAGEAAMPAHQGRRGARARKGGGSEGLGVGASRVKRPSVPDVLIGALPIWFL